MGRTALAVSPGREPRNHPSLCQEEPSQGEELAPMFFKAPLPYCGMGCTALAVSPGGEPRNYPSLCQEAQSQGEELAPMSFKAPLPYRERDVLLLRFCLEGIPGTIPLCARRRKSSTLDPNIEIPTFEPVGAFLQEEVANVISSLKEEVKELKRMMMELLNLL
ncbi:hypothetical protein NDU88_002322 [Pleurodeles waltl]|uniref:Uncharacterized protein n=1 Tax=Pleurodeles waltl TaxID=8319 RepID=A0AAV7MR30_PLEWA|nr:hypothetical protein NDU88_002322 [Pleurodeles waltl]